jgi:hypothetical protein
MPGTKILELIQLDLLSLSKGRCGPLPTVRWIVFALWLTNCQDVDDLLSPVVINNTRTSHLNLIRDLARNHDVVLDDVGVDDAIANPQMNRIRRCASLVVKMCDQERWLRRGGILRAFLPDLSEKLLLALSHANSKILRDEALVDALDLDLALARDLHPTSNLANVPKLRFPRGRRWLTPNRFVRSLGNRFRSDDLILKAIRSRSLANRRLYVDIAVVLNDLCIAELRRQGKSKATEGLWLSRVRAVEPAASKHAATAT